MSLRFSEHLFPTPAGERNALVLQPQSAFVWDRERLEQMRKAFSKRSRVDRAILAHVRGAAGSYHAMILEGHAADGARLEFAPEMGDEEAGELARLFVEAHLPVQIEALRFGVSVFVHTSLPAREVRCFRDAAATLAAALQAADDSPVEVWILQRFVHYVEAGISRTLAELLPRRLPELEAEAAYMRSRL